LIFVAPRFVYLVTKLIYVTLESFSSLRIGLHIRRDISVKRLFIDGTFYMYLLTYSSTATTVAFVRWLKSPNLDVFGHYFRSYFITFLISYGLSQNCKKRLLVLLCLFIPPPPPVHLSVCGCSFSCKNSAPTGRTFMNLDN
jgi:hypothetical protein